MNESCPIAKQYGMTPEDHWRNGCAVHESHPPAWQHLIAWAVMVPMAVVANFSLIWGSIWLVRWLT